MRPATTWLARTTRAAAKKPFAAPHARMASSLLKMPAMSPTMTEGGLASWKVKEGEAFAAGDVLLEIETDKATIDVEAQDDGVMGKILVQAGQKGVPVGEAIAVLAEEGDDLNNLDVPSEGSAQAEKPKEEAKEEVKPAKEEKSEEEGAKPSGSETAKPVHKELDTSKQMFPSVARLLIESDLTQEQIDKIKPTGIHGMLTKGDVLFALGKISNPYGSAEKLLTDPILPGGRRASEPKPTGGKGAAAPPAKPLTGPELRRLIVKGMSKATAPRPQAEDVTATAKITDAEFDAILGDYSTLLPPPPPSVGHASEPSAPKEDEYAGLF